MQLYDPSITGESAVFRAAEFLYAAMFALNSADGDGTDPYRQFAVQQPFSPFGHTANGLRALYRDLAAMRGFTPALATRLADMAFSVSLDLAGEDNPATNAFEHACGEMRALIAEENEEWDMAAHEESRHFGSLDG